MSELKHMLIGVAPFDATNIRLALWPSDDPEGGCSILLTLDKAAKFAASILNTIDETLGTK